MLHVHRPFRATCCLGPIMCNPQEVTVMTPTAGLVGRAVFDWRWWNTCLPCWSRYRLEDAKGTVTHYVETPALCAAGCSNLCAPTCFNEVWKAPVIDAASGEEVGALENQWPGWNLFGLVCRQGATQADNFVIKFPKSATAEHHQRATLFGSLLLLNNFTLFENRTKGSVLELASEKRPRDFDQSVSARTISQKPNHSIINVVLSKYFEDLGKIARAPLLTSDRPSERKQ